MFYSEEEDDDEDYYSSSSSKIITTTTTMETKSSNLTENDKSRFVMININRLWKFLLIFLINFFVLFVNCTIIIIVIQVNLKVNKVNEKGIIKERKQKYEMVFYQKGENGEYNDEKMIRNEIMVMGNEFVDDKEDFYPLVNDEGSGYISQVIDGGDVEEVQVEKKEYKMCIEECRCIVECENNDECENGLECVDYECVESLKSRKETKEKEVAQVSVIVIPMFLCLYGIFASMNFAKEYGKEYFFIFCKKKKCPPKTKEVESDVWATDLNKIQRKSFTCEGHCLKIEKEEGRTLKMMRNIVAFESNAYILNGFNEWIQENNNDIKETCQEKIIIREIIANDKSEAESIFSTESSVLCQKVEYYWDTKPLSKIIGLKEIYDKNFSDWVFPWDNYCSLNWQSIQCY